MIFTKCPSPTKYSIVNHLNEVRLKLNIMLNRLKCYLISNNYMMV